MISSKNGIRWGRTLLNGRRPNNEAAGRASNQLLRLPHDLRLEMSVSAVLTGLTTENYKNFILFNLGEI